VKCSNHFGAKRVRVIKSGYSFGTKGAIQNYIKNMSYDISPFLRGCLHVTCESEIQE
jgi:hypothetical protein